MALGLRIDGFHKRLNVHPFHIVVSVVNLIAAAAAACSVALSSHLGATVREGLLAFGVVAGYLANLFAVLVGGVILSWVLLVAARGRSVRAIWSKHRLGVANAAVVVLFWTVLFALVGLHI